VTLAAYPIAVIARMMRASTIETMGLDYVRTARAYGLREGFILRRLALRNAILPVLSVIGLTLAYSLTGSFFVEIVYSWPGLGTYAVKSILNVDYPAIMGITLIGAAAYVLINLAVDIGQAWLDPRIRLT
jgi:ABC-type dipeptide/oligopeptide/nickel transport system permease component